MGLSDFVKIANDELGYKEGSDGYTKYGDYCGTAYAGWCTAFIAWCAKEAGIVTTDDTGAVPLVKKTASTSAMHTFYKNSSRDLDPKTDSNSSNYPMVGDIIFVNNDAHTGIVVEISGSTMYAIEGNYSDKVSKVKYSTRTNSSGKSVWYNPNDGNKEVNALGSNNKSY